MPDILITTLKSIIANIGYRNIKDLSSTSIGVVVPKTIVQKVIPTLTVALKEWKPKVVSDLELRIGRFSVFSKNENLQKGRTSFGQGRGNEFALQSALLEYRADYGKPITVEFVGDRQKFTANNIIDVRHVGAKDVFQRNKADLHLINTNMQAIPLSIKDITAGAWESADSYWGEKAKQFLMWALDTKQTQLQDNHDGSYSVRPAIALAASPQEIKDVVFGADIYRKGAVIVQQFRADNFTWDYTRDVLTVKCAHVILTENDIYGGNEVYFQIRNDRERNPKFLYRGLRTIATMKSHLQGVKVFESNTRNEVGL